jgi:hypothetical protein
MEERVKWEPPHLQTNHHLHLQLQRSAMSSLGLLHSTHSTSQSKEARSHYNVPLSRYALIRPKSILYDKPELLCRLEPQRYKPFPYANLRGHPDLPPTWVMVDRARGSACPPRDLGVTSWRPRRSKWNRGNRCRANRGSQSLIPAQL